MKNRFKTILIWMAINSIIGLLIFSITYGLYKNSSMAVSDILIFTLFSCHVISSITALSGYFAEFLIRNKNFHLFFRYFIVFSATSLASLGGLALTTSVSRYFFTGLSHGYLNQSLFSYIAPTLFISFLVTFLTITIKHLQFSRNSLVEEINSLQTMEEMRIKKREKTHLSFKEKSKNFTIPFTEIIYLSSSGKKTLIHTDSRDFEIWTLLKDVLDDLNDDFLRIHKQFIININFLSELKYNQGGRYLAILNDEDETLLPVGKNQTPFLKKLLQMR